MVWSSNIPNDHSNINQNHRDPARDYRTQETSKIHAINSSGSCSHPVAHHRIYTMIGGTKAPQLYLLASLNLLGITVSPLNGHIGIRISIHKHIESARFAEFGQECDWCGDLPEECSDLRLDLFICQCFRECCWRSGRTLVVSIGKGRINEQWKTYSGVVFSLSDVFCDCLGLFGLLNWTCLMLVSIESCDAGQFTSNCHRSTCSPVSLLVITMTIFEIFWPSIHLLSWDMIFLMYAFTWSSEVTVCGWVHFYGLASKVSYLAYSGHISLPCEVVSAGGLSSRNG